MQQMIIVKDFLRQKIGILGGGQLGKMLCQSGSRWGLDLYVLDQDPSFPAGQVNPHFVIGDFNNEVDVFDFGLDKDVITIEIEHVAVAALERLQQEGVAVYPDPSVLRIIQDKGEQKQFFSRHGLPTAPFRLYPDKVAIIEAIANGAEPLPFVHL